jgi:hypothetical protein
MRLVTPRGFSSLFIMEVDTPHPVLPNPINVP